MAEQPKRKSVFAMAKRSAAVTMEITPEDVLRMRPHWSREEAEAFLIANADAIAARTLAAGLGVVLAAIEAEEKQCQGPTN